MRFLFKWVRGDKICLAVFPSSLTIWIRTSHILLIHHYSSTFSLILHNLSFVKWRNRIIQVCLQTKPKGTSRPRYFVVKHRIDTVARQVSSCIWNVLQLYSDCWGDVSKQSRDSILDVSCFPFWMGSNYSATVDIFANTKLVDI